MSPMGDINMESCLRSQEGMNHWPPQDKPELTAGRRAEYWLNYIAKACRRQLLFVVIISLHTEGKKYTKTKKKRKREQIAQLP